MGGFTNSRRVTTRKPHRCWWCNTMIPAGESAIVSSGVYEDHFFRAYTHPECDQACLRDKDYEPEETFEKRSRGKTWAETDAEIGG